MCNLCKWSSFILRRQLDCGKDTYEVLPSFPQSNLEHFITPERNLVHFYSYFLTCRNQTSTFYLPVLGSSNKWNHMRCGFCACLLSFSMFSKFTYVAVLLSFCGWMIFHLYGYAICNSSSADGQLGCVHVLPE